MTEALGLYILYYYYYGSCYVSTAFRRQQSKNIGCENTVFEISAVFHFCAVISPDGIAFFESVTRARTNSIKKRVTLHYYYYCTMKLFCSQKKTKNNYSLINYAQYFRMVNNSVYRTSARYYNILLLFNRNWIVRILIKKPRFFLLLFKTRFRLENVLSIIEKIYYSNNNNKISTLNIT